MARGVQQSPSLGEKGGAWPGRLWGRRQGQGGKGVGPCVSLLVWEGRGFGLHMESWNESEETAERVARYVFLGRISSYLHFLFLLNITENTGLVFLKILQCLLGL